MNLDPEMPELQFALQAVRHAAEVTRAVQADLEANTITKSDRSPVTVADFAAQAVVARQLEDRFPDVALVGEEDSGVLREESGRPVLDAVTKLVQSVEPGATPEQVCAWIDRGNVDPPERFWTLDPIDGTKGFLRGDQYAIALALIESGQVQLGVLACPNLDRDCLPDVGGQGVLLAAVRGQGTGSAPLDGSEDFQPLRVSQSEDLSEARLLRSYESGHTDAGGIGAIAKKLGLQADPVLMDSQAKYALLASGRAELLFRLLSPKQPDYKEKIWDQAAGAIVLEEAGGRITDLFGQPLDFSRGRTLANNTGVCATSGPFHDAAIEVLREMHAG
jgi:3'(2'), 5'-bisphosphate nucleotidase